MSENADANDEIRLSDLDDEMLEAGLIARLISYPSDYFLYAIMSIDASCFAAAPARRVYNAVVQGLTTSYRASMNFAVEDLNIAETDSEALSYIRRVIDGGYPYGPHLPKCLLELHDRSLLRHLAEQEAFDEEWQQISQELSDDPDELPW